MVFCRGDRSHVPRLLRRRLHVWENASARAERSRSLFLRYVISIANTTVGLAIGGDQRTAKSRGDEDRIVDDLQHLLPRREARFATARRMTLL
jgi:hypothetical protein